MHSRSRVMLPSLPCTLSPDARGAGRPRPFHCLWLSHLPRGSLPHCPHLRSVVGDEPAFSDGHSPSLSPPRQRW